MARTQTQTRTTTAIILYTFFIIFSLSILPSTSSNFTLKLTHIDSPLSPLYQSNLSDFQRLTKQVEISVSRASYFHLINYKNVSIRLPLIYQEPTLTVEIGIGTPPVTRTLIFDTGSHLTWTQCTPCRKCFEQNDPLFNPKNSSSYKPLPKTHPLAKGFACNIFGKCSYKINYTSGQSTTGTAAMESFTFQSNAGTPARVSDLVFGCSTNSIGAFPSQITGILGFSQHPTSLARQLGSFIGGRFSYCITPNGSYLRFGNEAVARGWRVQRTRFFNTANTPMLYGLNLFDISINGKRLRLGRYTFAEGSFIDSGTTVSMLNRRAFFGVTSSLDKYFSEFEDVKRYEGDLAPKWMRCYTLPVNFRRFPSMTFHFEGANYGVPAENLFKLIKGEDGTSVFCLAVAETKGITVLGAYQQRNVRIVYDLRKQMLSFVKEDCSRDGA